MSKFEYLGGGVIIPLPKPVEIVQEPAPVERDWIRNPMTRYELVEMMREHDRTWPLTPEGIAAAERERIYAENYRRERERN